MSERDEQPPARALFCAALLLVLLFGYLRVRQLGVPAHTTWDEDHFVLNARNFLAGKPDWNDHPPLGKLLMALPMLALGDSAFSFRLSAACAGLASIVLGFFAGRGLFRDWRAGALCAALIAIDGPLLVYSRTALLDGVLLMFGLACLVALTRPATIASALGAGALLGCAASIKFSGIALALPLLAFVLASPRRVARKLALLSAAGLAAGGVYYAQYAVGHALTGLGTSPADIARASLKLVSHHAVLTEMKHPMTSPWQSWPLPMEPLHMRRAIVDGYRVQMMTMLDNPLLWWGGWISALASVALLAVAAVRRKLAELQHLALPLAGWLGFLLPWILSKRDSYLYHYVPAHGFALVLLAGFLFRAYRRRPVPAFAAFLVIALVSIFYAPLWAELPIAPEAINWRLFLPSWR